MTGVQCRKWRGSSKTVPASPCTEQCISLVWREQPNDSAIISVHPLTYVKLPQKLGLSSSNVTFFGNQSRIWPSDLSGSCGMIYLEATSTEINQTAFVVVNFLKDL